MDALNNVFKEFLADPYALADCADVEDVKNAFISYMQEIADDIDIKGNIAAVLGQDDAMDDEDWLKDRREYWEEPQNNESDEEVEQQINGLNILLS